MSTTNHANGGNTNPHQDAVVGFEETDFNWRLVLFALPVSVLILLGFTLICLFGFRGYKDAEISKKAADFETPELNILHAKENETLTQYKILDNDKGLIQIPIARAMELVVNEHNNIAGAKHAPKHDSDAHLKKDK